MASEGEHRYIANYEGVAGAGRYHIQIGRPRRPTTDYGSSMIQWMRHRKRQRTRLEQERPSASYIVDMLPPLARITNPADSVPSKHLHSSLNKIKHPVNVVRWTPEGRRLLTGSSSGEFTLWNGMSFNFETIMSAHESAIRAAVWSHSDDWLVSADQDGVIKYWQPNFNNVKAIQGHEAPIRDLAFAPTDTKFVTASDDASLKIWDFSRGSEESVLTGHGWDAKTVDWHPQKGLLVSGSKDHQVKLWDPRTGRCLTTLHGHKNMISKTAFEPIKGQLLATCAKDQTARVFDLRMMRDVLLLKGHERDIMTLTWHPIHSSLLSTGGADGALHHYLLDEPNQPDGTAPTVSPYDSLDPANAPAQSIFPAHKVTHAHESAIWSLDWHPLGHILASGSNDRITRFWARARPGEAECFKDRYHLGDAAAEAHGTWNRNKSKQQAHDDEEQEEADEEDGLVDQKMPTQRPGLPGLPGISLPGMGDGTSQGGAQINMLPGFSAAPPPPTAAIPQNLAAMLNTQAIPPPPPGYTTMAQNGLPPNGLPPFPPPPGMLPPGLLPPGFPGMPAPPPMFADGGLTQSATPDPRSARKRAPLPSQQDSLKEELRRGNIRAAR